MTHHPKSPPYRGRFAPSPSGALHFGSLVTALGSWLDARSQQGQWLVRIEDIDPPREKPGAASQILHTLEAAGLHWDGSILYQSNRTEAYQKALEFLSQKGHTYPCNCSRKDVSLVATPGIEGSVYPGTCRSGLGGSQSKTAIRLITRDSPIIFHDRLFGRCEQKLESSIGDFVIRRSDQQVAYQLAVVIDDSFQQITQIVRGADLLHSTQRQIFLQQILGLTTPSYLHLPLVLDKTGNKLSKQNRANPVDPAKPLPSLIKAWVFLGQKSPETTFSNTREFLLWAQQRWQVDQISQQVKFTSLSSHGTYQ